MMMQVYDPYAEPMLCPPPLPASRTSTSPVRMEPQPPGLLVPHAGIMGDSSTRLSGVMGNVPPPPGLVPPPPGLFHNYDSSDAMSEGSSTTGSAMSGFDCDLCKQGKPHRQHVMIHSNKRKSRRRRSSVSTILFPLAPCSSGY